MSKTRILEINHEGMAKQGHLIREHASDRTLAFVRSKHFDHTGEKI